MSTDNLKTVDDYINLSKVKPDYHINYGDHSEQFGELYLPKIGKSFPTIILIHGGCWRAQFGLSQLGSLAKALTGLGYAVWNLEFRRLGNGGGWPTTFEDIALGADFLKKISHKYFLDLKQVSTMGHSAGGHLALWLAGRHHLPEHSQLFSEEPLKLQRVISLAGIPDLIEGVEQNLCRGACQELVGSLPQEAPDLYKQASPHFLLPLNIPQWHLMGEHDPIVPTRYLDPYIEIAKRWDEVHFDVIPNIGHFEMVMPNTASWKYIKNALANSA